MQNEIAYSRPVTLINILRFAVPTIAMSVFMSFYTMVDGLFVSNLIGSAVGRKLVMLSGVGCRVLINGDTAGTYRSQTAP